MKSEGYESRKSENIFLQKRVGVGGEGRVGGWVGRGRSSSGLEERKVIWTGAQGGGGGGVDS